MDMVSVRDALYQERNWELSHEGKGWFDQIRPNSLDPGYWKSSMAQHDPETVTRGDLSEFRMRFPIPAPERALNSNHTQNPGYWPQGSSGRAGVATCRAGPPAVQQ